MSDYEILKELIITYLDPVTFARCKMVDSTLNKVYKFYDDIVMESYLKKTLGDEFYEVIKSELDDLFPVPVLDTLRILCRDEGSTLRYFIEKHAALSRPYETLMKDFSFAHLIPKIDAKCGMTDYATCVTAQFVLLQSSWMSRQTSLASVPIELDIALEMTKKYLDKFQGLERDTNTKIIDKKIKKKDEVDSLASLGRTKI